MQRKIKVGYDKVDGKISLDIYETINNAGSTIKKATHTSLEEAIVNLQAQEGLGLMYNLELEIARDERIYNPETKMIESYPYVIFKAIFNDNYGRKVVKFGGVNKESLTDEIQRQFPVETAEKRAFDRAALRYLGLTGVYSDAEIPDDHNEMSEKIIGKEEKENVKKMEETLTDIEEKSFEDEFEDVDEDFEDVFNGDITEDVAETSEKDNVQTVIETDTEDSADESLFDDDMLNDFLEEETSENQPVANDDNEDFEDIFEDDFEDAFEDDFETPVEETEAEDTYIDDATKALGEQKIGIGKYKTLSIAEMYKTATKDDNEGKEVRSWIKYIFDKNFENRQELINALKQYGKAIGQDYEE